MDILGELKKAGAVLLDKHFVYKSGKHGSGYINMDPLFPRIDLIEAIGERLVMPFRATWTDSERPPVQTVAAPATGGILLAYAAAKAWHASNRPLPAVWADKDGNDFVFERAGFTEHLSGRNVLVVEDLLTTGESAEKVCREAEKNGANIIGISAIVNRGGVTASSLAVPRLESLANVSFEAVNAHLCQLCANEVPIVEDIGHGMDFKEKNPNYGGGYIKLLR